MTRTQQKSEKTDAESQPAKLTKRTIAGEEIAVVQSPSAALTCVQSGPRTVILDLNQISVPDRRFLIWFLTMSDDRHRILITGSDEIPVAPIRIDGMIQKPLSDEKLRAFLTEFDYREKYAAVLSEYINCICHNGSSPREDKLQLLQSELTELRETLNNLGETSAMTTFGRTMREILQKECNT